ncbi:MAG TPA: carboxypeptidase regulatory-like domain-containing protein, partial [Candidatus Polarisedimenticolaceae bacterium]|nr:carboxypeptidase regulatory-like domain-containing protein [Candidatus Polarisedimenticolaceae bacterium]
LPLGRTDERGQLALSAAAKDSLALAVLAGDGRRLETRLAGPAKPLTLPDRSFVSGRLIDADTRRPITGGLVWDAGNPLEGAVSDGAGGFALGGPTGSRMQITAGAPGYILTDGTTFQLADDGRAGPTLALRPAAAIEGQVVDAEGRPVAGAEVQLAVKPTPGTMRIEIGRATVAPRAQTTAAGRFRLSSVDPQPSWIARVRAAGFAPASVDVTGLEPRRTKTGVRITLTQGKTLTGKVADADGRPIREAEVTARAAQSERRMGPMRLGDGSSGGPEFRVMTDDGGGFALHGMPAGSFDLTVRRRGFAKRTVPAVTFEERGETLDMGTVTLEPGERLQGVVLDRQRQPVEGAEVRIAEGGPTMMLAMPGGGGAKPREPDAVSDASGWFAVEDLRRGEKVGLSIRHAGYLEAQLSGLDVPHVEPIEALLEPSSTLSGRVVNSSGEPIAGADVRLRRTQTMEMGGMAMAMVRIESDQSDAEGRYVFKDLDPGKVSISAVATGFQEAKRDDIEVPKGSDLDGVELALQAGAIVEGQVLAPDGKPAIGAEVGLAGGDESEGPMRFRGLGGTTTDGNGYYRLEGLAPGTVSVEATHADYPRVVKDLEAKEGINSLQLQFQGGQEVTGRVTDTAGAALSNAAVRLVRGSNFFGGSDARTGADGSFRLAGVRDGEYRLWVEAEGYAPSTGEREVKVTGQPVGGIEVQLTTGAAIVGRVTGLKPEDLPKVNVRAEGPNVSEFGGAGVNGSGDYRLEHLRPGSYEVLARVGDSGRQARAQAKLEAGAAEVRVDLQFGGGLKLSGRAVQGDQPVAGAVVSVQGVDIDSSGWAQTDAGGRFAIDGLEAGRYGVRLQNWQSGLSHEESLDLATSREVTIEIPTAAVRGRVVDAADGRPLAGVAVALASPQGAPSEFRRANHLTTSDMDGKFELPSVAAGSFRLTAEKKGYATASLAVEVQGDRGVDDVRLRMDPTDGVTLEARMPSGTAPDELRVAVLDGSGSSLVGGTYATGENGRVRLSTVPPGSWETLVAAEGAATTQLTVHAPGGAIPVQLPPPCRLRISVPGMNGSSSVGTVTVDGSDGRRLRTLNWMGAPTAEWRMVGGQLELASLPPGEWTVHVTAPDGRSWQGRSATTPGSTAELVLR